ERRAGRQRAGGASQPAQGARGRSGLLRHGQDRRCRGRRAGPPPPLHQDGAAHQAHPRPRRGQREQGRGPRPHLRDPPPVEAEALAHRRSPREGKV
ncbi:MAG: SSU ribosomal protein S17p (S11e), partial [uncultured Thermomicrobiales bacterium]